jgi:hypothetical protein
MARQSFEMNILAERVFTVAESPNGSAGMNFSRTDS